MKYLVLVAIMCSLLGCQDSIEQAIYEADSIECWQQNPLPQKEINRRYRERGFRVQLHSDRE